MAFKDVEGDSVLIIIGVITDIVFMLDLLVNCFTAYHDEEGKLITNNK